MYDGGFAETPKEVVEQWLERFNTADLDGLADLYSDDAINHQVMFEPVEGKGAIREFFRAALSGPELVCIPDIIHEAGQVAILEWRDPHGLRGCGFFTVTGDKIVFQRGYWDQMSFRRLHNLPMD